jgi:DNA repair protein RAD50
MSSIDRLLIQGIRSFSPATAQVIKVFTPLTLIVGQNGTGKTTIIECLRYATTGELPPNSATGGAWLHDPKLMGESETLGEVRLSFTTPDGQYMVINRKLQLTVKKTTRSQKTLDGQLVMKKPNGERMVISSRVAELDNLIPKYLGVSKAILDAVIFCHQDDSLWPMSTPALLKKRFDEIFEAHKYTKAIDNIKAIRKKYAEELGKLEVEERHATEKKEKAARVEKQMEDLADEIEVHRRQVEEFDGQIKEAIKETDIAYTAAAKYEKIVAELEGKRIQAQTLEQSIESITLNMRRMNESDQELQTMQNEYEKHVERLVANKQELGTHWTQANTDLASLRKNLGSKQTEVGRLESEMQRYESQLVARQNLIKETATRHKIWDLDHDITGEVVQRFMDDLARAARDQQATYNKARQITQNKLAESRKSLDTLNETRSGLIKDKESCRLKLETNEKHINDLQRQVDTVDVDEGRKAVLEAHLQDVENQLKKAKAELHTAAWGQKIAEIDEKLSALQDRKDRLEAEQSEAARQAADLGQLDYLSKELKDKQKWLETSSYTHDSQFKKLLSIIWTPANLDETYKLVIADRSETVRNAEIHRDSLFRDHETCQFQFKDASNTVTSKRQKLEAAYKKVHDVIEDEPSQFPKSLKTVEENVTNLTVDKANFDSMKDYFKNCAQWADEKNACKLCERPLKPSEKPKFNQRLQALQDRKAALETAEELAFFESELANHRNVSSTYESWVQLTSEIPVSEKALAEIEARRDDIGRKLEEAQEDVKTLNSRKSEVEALNKVVQSIIKCQGEIINYTNQLAELEAKAENTGSARGSSIIQDDIKQINTTVKNLNTQQKEFRSNKDRKQTQINSLEISSRDERVKLAEVTHKLTNKAALETRISDYRTDNANQRNAMQTVDDNIQPLSFQITQAQQLIQDETQRGNAQEQDLLAELSQTKESISHIDMASKEINNFVANDGPQALARGSKDMDSIKAKIEQTENAIKSIGRNVNKADEELRNHDDTKRAIADNLAYRLNKKKLAILKEEVEHLEQTNSAADKHRYEQVASQWAAKRSQLASDQATIVGSATTKHNQYTALEDEWKREYKDASQKYKEAHVRSTVTKEAISDLAKYASALDQAIMKYHGLKMEEINNSISNLWRQTYRGTDVDSISIRSEHESGKGNKSYNYRVVMAKQNTEMDMRGRCSAGQKVLASIIIRLALAECFSVNCGMIALDEPTTNLDRDNIISLARSLNELIKMRRNQKNFQLIIITHDEDFLRNMNCGELTDDYFRVSRNLKQKSEVKSQKISLI